MNAKRTRTPMLNLVTLTAILAVLPSMSYARTEWTTVTTMPTPRVALSVSVVNGKIYAIGGRTDPLAGLSRVSAVEEYDPATGQWTIKANMPTARHALSTSVVNGKIYAIGGFPGGPATPSVEVYDPVTDTWTRKADMLAAKAGHGAGVVDGKIYVIGGAEVQVYDPAMDTWSTVTDMPTTRSPCVSVVGGKIYAVGGSGVGPSWPALSVVEEYDPATDTWTRKADMPTPRSGFATTVVDGRIYALGGTDSLGTDPSQNSLRVVEMYDPALDTWVEGPSMTNPRVETAACTVDGKIYVIGGWRQTYSGSFGPVEMLDLNPIVDFNADGAVDLDDLLILIDAWGMNDPLVDIGPMPWGDGMVDSRDLLVLAEYMVEYVPQRASNPMPASGATNIAPDAVLSWRAGNEAAMHELYLSADVNAVADGSAWVATIADPNYDLASLNLDLGQTYFWKVNEVNDLEDPSVWEGDIWNFTLYHSGR